MTLALSDINGWLLEFYVLRSYQDGYRLVTVHNHGYFIVLGDQAVGAMAQYPTQSHYPDTELTSPCPILLMMCARLGSGKSQFVKSLV